MAKSAHKYVYNFKEGDGKNKRLLGCKGANLCEMTQMGLSVPPGFVITTEACLQYYEQGKNMPAGLMDEIKKEMAVVEKTTGKSFGDPKNPLLVSVRPGGAMPMPGIMDTVLNLGLNDETVKALATLTNNERFAYDAYRRLLQLFGQVALGIDGEFDSIMSAAKQALNTTDETKLTAADMKRISEDFKAVIQSQTKTDFPQDPYTQLEMAIKAVFGSWMGKRAADHRREFNITPDMANGTAVNICTMVFGNMGNDSCTGVAFTRNPATGENRLFGTYLTNAQGKDVVASIRTPKEIQKLRREMPKVYKELEDLRHALENHFREVQDFEFTVEKKKLYALQTRNGKMSAWARVKTCNDMVNEALMTEDEAILRVDPKQLEQLLHPAIDKSTGAKPVCKGIGGSPGAASGKVMFDVDRAEQAGKAGEKVILVRDEAKSSDIYGFFASQGILTSRGEKTSQVAVVAREMGKPYVCGCKDLVIDFRARTAKIGKQSVQEGDIITIDGANGTVYMDTVPTVESEFVGDMLTLLHWADDIATLGVMANADTPEMAQKARSYGAQGIGLCRTERMFNHPSRLPVVREMILANSPKERQAAIDKLMPLQKEDFKAIFQAMEGLPVAIRLLDRPIHEFLPTQEEVMTELSLLKEFEETINAMEELPEAMRILDPSLQKFIPGIKTTLEAIHKIREQNVDKKLIRYKEELLAKVKAVAEINPMLGHRGVRLGISYPEIYAMQIHAILEAVAELIQEDHDIKPEIMVPQVCTLQELKWVHRLVTAINDSVTKKYKVNIAFKFGTMIEVVRACMRADKLAELAEFFSFGTNDLTQATFSFSREDAENKFLPLYNENKILHDNPFEILDIHGVGRLMKMTVELGRKTKKDLKVGICGEQSGHPDAVKFCHAIGMTYVSCSPHRVPIARLAAAQAKLLEKTLKYD
ncbi:MAG: pyruvate, phosphate dikinase [Deltaproteobacteria bacterium]|nr:pyruvate, phosphate dikinase [Deltaproteobacteria bacterium]